MKASNLVPSFLGQPVVDIDSYEDGKLLLLTLKNCLLLVPTVVDNKTAFDFMFRKDKKPQMIQLRVSLQALLRNGKKEPNLTKGEFHVDQKTKNITIICVNENLIVFWQMRDIMNGRTESQEI